MKIQTISFELAKKLDSLGVKQDSWLAYWEISSEIIDRLGWQESHCHKAIKTNRLYLHAYMLEEILGMLPHYSLCICKSLCNGSCESMQEKGTLNKTTISFRLEYGGKIEVSHKNPVEAAGKLLKVCIEEGYVKIEKENN